MSTTNPTPTASPDPAATTQTPTRPRPEPRPVEELKALAEAGARELAGDPENGVPEANPADVIRWVSRNFDTAACAVACSMADAALPHYVAQYQPGVDVLFLDTGYHFRETYDTRNEVARRVDVHIVDVLPEQTVEEQNAEFGKDLFARDPGLCCARRKVAPLKKSLNGYELWFTGVRRDEAPTRTNTPLITFDEKNGLVKVNPLAAWSFDDLLDYSRAFDVPVNPLLTQGYPSIGCQPCTRPVAEGEDPRAGRWAGSTKTECGLHT